MHSGLAYPSGTGWPSGCSAGGHVHARASWKEVARLDGFNADTELGRTREVTSEDGASVTVTPDSTLRFRFIDRSLGAASYLRIEARPDFFRGTLSDGRTLTVASPLLGGEVSDVSVGRTVAAAILGTLGIGVLGVAIAFGVFVGMLSASRAY